MTLTDATSAGTVSESVQEVPGTGVLTTATATANPGLAVYCAGEIAQASASAGVAVTPTSPALSKIAAPAALTRDLIDTTGSFAHRHEQNRDPI